MSEKNNFASCNDEVDYNALSQYSIDNDDDDKKNNGNEEEDDGDDEGDDDDGDLLEKWRHDGYESDDLDFDSQEKLKVNQYDNKMLKKSIGAITKINDTIPSSVEKVMTKYGVEVYLVGTLHFSVESQQDVIDTIFNVIPDVVILELDSRRSGMLYVSDEDRNKSTIDMKDMRNIIKRLGVKKGVTYLMMQHLSNKLTKKLGMPPGGEFIAAYKASNIIQPKAIVSYGDRDIDITIQRCLGCLTFVQKLKLIWHFIWSDTDDITKENLEKLKQKDFLEELFAEMGDEFPALRQIIVEERDQYLGYSIHKCAETLGNLNWQNKNWKIVAVIGLGHLKGVIHYINEPPDSTAELVRIPPPTTGSKCFGLFIRGIKLSIGGWCLYRFSKFVYPSVFGIYTNALSYMY